MDICGEYSEAQDIIEAQEAGLLNEHTNVEILEEVKLEADKGKITVNDSE